MADSAEKAQIEQVDPPEAGGGALDWVDRAFDSPQALATALARWPHFVERHRELVAHQDSIDDAYAQIYNAAISALQQQAAGASGFQIAAMEAEFARSVAPWFQAREQAGAEIGPAVALLERVLAGLMRSDGRVIMSIPEAHVTPVDMSYVERAAVILRAVWLKSILDDNHFFDAPADSRAAQPVSTDEFQPRAGEAPIKPWRGSIHELRDLMVMDRVDYSRQRERLAGKRNYSERHRALLADTEHKQYRIDVALALMLDEIEQGTRRDRESLVRHIVAAVSPSARSLLVKEMTTDYSWLETVYLRRIHALNRMLQDGAGDNTLEGLQRRLLITKALAQKTAAYRALKYMHQRERRVLGLQPNDK